MKSHTRPQPALRATLVVLGLFEDVLAEDHAVTGRHTANIVWDDEQADAMPVRVRNDGLYLASGRNWVAREDW